MNLKPLGKRVLVETEKEGGTTEAGLFIPLAARGGFVKGTVLDTGSDVESCLLDTGVKVLIPRLIAEKSELDKDAGQILVDEEDILGVLHEEEKTEDETPAE